MYIFLPEQFAYPTLINTPLHKGKVDIPTALFSIPLFSFSIPIYTLIETYQVSVYPFCIQFAPVKKESTKKGEGQGGANSINDNMWHLYPFVMWLQ